MKILITGGSERLSRYELIETAAEYLGVDKNLIGKNSMENANIKYKVKDVSLSIEKLKSYGIVPKSVHESMEKIAEVLKD